MNDDRFFFAYTHMSNDGNWDFSREYEYGTSWDVVLTDFLSFLSGIYGYPIGPKVDYSGNPDGSGDWE